MNFTLKFVNNSVIRNYTAICTIVARHSRLELWWEKPGYTRASAGAAAGADIKIMDEILTAECCLLIAGLP